MNSYNQRQPDPNVKTYWDSAEPMLRAVLLWQRHIWNLPAEESRSVQVAQRVGEGSKRVWGGGRGVFWVRRGQNRNGIKPRRGGISAGNACQILTHTLGSFQRHKDNHNNVCNNK